MAAERTALGAAPLTAVKSTTTPKPKTSQRRPDCLPERAANAAKNEKIKLM
jgi:hypothetical protein